MCIERERQLSQVHGNLHSANIQVMIADGELYSDVNLFLWQVKLICCSFYTLMSGYLIILPFPGGNLGLSL